MTEDTDPPEDMFSKPIDLKTAVSGPVGDFDPKAFLRYKDLSQVLGNSLKLFASSIVTEPLFRASYSLSCSERTSRSLSRESTSAFAKSVSPRHPFRPMMIPDYARFMAIAVEQIDESMGKIMGK